MIRVEVCGLILGWLSSHLLHLSNRSWCCIGTHYHHSVHLHWLYGLCCWILWPSPTSHAREHFQQVFVITTNQSVYACWNVSTRRGSVLSWNKGPHIHALNRRQFSLFCSFVCWINTGQSTKCCIPVSYVDVPFSLLASHFLWKVTSCYKSIHSNSTLPTRSPQSC